MLGHSISRNSLILGVFAAITASAIAVTFQTTKTRIEKEERKAASAALIDMVPKTRHNNDMLSDLLTLSASDSEFLNLAVPNPQAYIARQDNRIEAFIIPTIAKDGYSGDIKMLVAVNRDGSLAGVRVIGHKETPGLGDKIDLRKSDWILSFNGLSLAKPPVERWAIKKEGGVFDQFTGATITPRAVINRVKSVLGLFGERKNDWLNQAQNLQPAGHEGLNYE